MMTTYDFHDGNGPVPAHQHRNPDGRVGGWVADTAQVSGEAWVETTPISIIGLPYLVTISDKHIQIGCLQLTFAQFSSFTATRAEHADGAQAVEFFTAYWPALQLLIDRHKKGAP